MNELESLHAASARLIEMSKAYYTTFPDQPALEPKHIDIYSKVIRDLCPEAMCSVPLEMTITTDSAGCHMLFRLAYDHVACISTVENTIGLYSCYRHNNDLEAALEHDPIYIGHLGADWN